MDKEKLQRIRAYYTHYRQEMRDLRDRIKQAHLWYKTQQTEFGSNKTDKNAPECRTGHLFNAVQYKHADIMDNFPHINILPREKADEELAKTLSGIMPFILENADFRRVYSSGSYDKLISGTSIYGVFYEQNDGGNIVIEKVDPLRFACQPGISDIQDSKYVFYDSFMDIEEFADLYGDRPNIQTQATYDEEKVGAERDFLSDVVVITDCYYKTYKDGKKILHFVKFSGGEVLDYTEGKEEYKDGLYKHGLYPFRFDVLHPDGDSLFGLGIVDIGKDVQAYIDKLDEIISTNALLCAEPRYVVAESAGINENELMNIKQKVVRAARSITNDDLHEIKPSNLPAFISNHREMKIEELKEILGNRDFSQGGTSGGVTAASAITALQNSGDKLSRDMINNSYYVFQEIVWLVIELIREFYTEERTYRILGEDGNFSYETFSNSGMQEHPVAGGIEEFFDTDEVEGVAELLDVPVTYEKPLFDITLTVEKNNPYQRAQHNELILALYNMKLFDPQNADVGKFVISNLNFDGKDKLLQQIEETQQAQAEQTKITTQTGGAEMPEEMTGGGEMLAFPVDNAPQEEMVAFPMS